MFHLTTHSTHFMYVYMTSDYHPTHRIAHASAGTRSSSMGPPCGIDLTTHCTMSGRSTMGLHIACYARGERSGDIDGQGKV